MPTTSQALDSHARAAEDVLATFDSDRGGLSASEAARRLHDHGRNELDKAAREPGWRKLVRIVRDPLTLVLLAAAVTSTIASRELETPIVILGVVIFNAVLNLVQERRAETSLSALAKLTITRARAMRDGEIVLVDSSELVPGATWCPPMRVCWTRPRWRSRRPR